MVKKDSTMSNVNLYHDVISDCISSATIKKLGGVLGMRLHIILVYTFT